MLETNSTLLIHLSGPTWTFTAKLDPVKEIITTGTPPPLNVLMSEFEKGVVAFRQHMNEVNK